MIIVFNIFVLEGSGGLNHLPYLLSISVSMAVIKDFSTNYIEALGLNQAYTGGLNHLFRRIIFSIHGHGK